METFIYLTNMLSLGTVQNFLLGGWYFLGKVPVKMQTPLGVSIKILETPLVVSVKDGYCLEGAGSFSGQQGCIAQKGHPGQRGELCERDIL